MHKNLFILVHFILLIKISLVTTCPTGYTLNGNDCIINNCSLDYECPTKYNFGICIEGLCGCLNNTGLIWNQSLTSLETKNTCHCPEGTRLFWSRGIPKCIPFGQCEEFWQCPQIYNQKQTISCGLLNDSIVRDFNVCLCNYGYENIGFDENCECAPNKKEVWSNYHNGMICLFEQECTQNDHCHSDNCIIKIGQWLGVCEQDYSSANKFHIFFI
ncbi:hypothetical protein H012_gp178 [Acanthamoeba polyphaga moumouvirus]|uniref:EGF-like domain-containing protein n=2 Tax=Moumouvirus TaxID=3080801 RepID=L7RDV1_9VIRU|nr:hypothetical protein H012_gp178 [Acanthamoeba polyphaga moumouvirus]AEX62385.1 putative EGF-like domain-containing protein [Moumouvirus Monve]AGC02273.1 hypothetical protein Moumou_00754 [Acanthamoeba polyphaga moumouvirus]AQN68614.1 hypothetical protein [Saudi moumouvirus]